MQTAVTNDITGQQIGKVATANLTAGMGSPYPSDSTPPVPSVNVTLVGPDVQEYIYMTGDQATVTQLDSGVQFRGSIASLTDGASSALASMSIDHVTSALNQEIKTLPVSQITATNGFGLGIIRGALTQWFGECGLFPDGVKGNVQMAIVNDLPGIGYYRHESMRYLGVSTSGSNIAQWLPTETAVVDQGISLGVGESVRMVIGLKTQTTNTLTSTAQFQFSATVASDFGDESLGNLIDPNLYFQYNSSTGALSLQERATGSPTKSVFSVTGVTTAKVPLFAEILMLRTAATTMSYGLRVVYQTDVTETVASASITNTYVPRRISASGVFLDSVRTSAGIASGIKSFYVTKEGVQNDKDTWQERGVAPTINAPNNTDWNFTTVPGVSGTGWQLVNDLSTAYGLFFDPLTISLGLPGAVTDAMISSAGHSGVTTSAQVRELAETVEIVNYNYTTSTSPTNNIPIFRADTAYSLNVGERQEHIVQTESTFSRLLQPVCVTPLEAAQAYINPLANKSLYSVYDSGNLPVTPAQWEASGGFISVESTRTLGELRIVIQAPTSADVTANWPLTITLETSVPSLLIAGVGAVPKKKTITSYTGAGQGINIKKLGTTYDSPFVAKDSQAWEVALLLGDLYGTTHTTLNANLVDDSLSTFALPYVLHKGSVYLPISWSKSGAMTSISSGIRYTSCAAMNREYEAITCGEYNTLFAGKTIRYANISPLQTRRA